MTHPSPLSPVQGCGIKLSEVQYMNPEEERQAQEKSLEESIQRVEQDLHFLNWQVSRLGKMIDRALKKVNTLDLSTP